MSMTIMIPKPLASYIPMTITELQKVLTSLTKRPARLAYTMFIDTVVSPKETIQFTTATQLKHPDSPFRLKRELLEDELIIAFVPEKGLLVIAGSNKMLETACTRLMMLIREQCTAFSNRRPRLEELFYCGTTHTIARAL